MKTFDKQEFAKLVLGIYTNYLQAYYYDSFYDIKRLRDMEENNKPASFHLYFRETGSDLLFHSEADGEDLHPTYMKRNNIALYVNYTPNINHCEDTYKIQIIKDKDNFLTSF
jgi:hypothetical protein